MVEGPVGGEVAAWAQARRGAATRADVATARAKQRVTGIGVSLRLALLQRL
jgi:hypothetical protein